MRPLAGSCVVIVVSSALAAQEPPIPDPALHRGFAMETAWSQRQGHGAGTLMLMLATPWLDYGVTQRITLVMGLPLPLVLMTGSSPPLAMSVKATLLDLPALRGAAGLFAVAPGGIWPYFALTAGTPRASLSCTLSPLVWTPHDESPATRVTVAQGLAAVQVARRAKLVVEGLYLGDERFLMGAGLRLFRQAFVLEMAGMYDPAERKIGPWLTFAWAW